tara:strand:+ start:895 stop:1335 length:441 start_codon:yes stop_codon:yes gene_type:complete
MKQEKRDPMLPFVRVVILSLILVLMSIWVFKNYFKSENSKINSSEIVTLKKLHFYDHPDGSIRITEVDGSLITFIKGEAFVRILLRNLVRDRISIGVGPEEPFELIARKGGLLSLRDPISDMHVDVTAFGQSNSKVFMQLIKGGDS